MIITKKMAGLSALMITLTLALSAAMGGDDKKSRSEDANTRSVQGVVTNANDAPVDGAVVQLKDTKTLQIRSFITKPEGEYHFFGLSTNVDYELKADHNGTSSASKTLSVFDSRKTAVMNLKLNK